VLPLNQVAETIRVSPDAIHEINRQGITWWREELIHVMDGGTVLGAAQTRDARAFLVVVVAGTSRRGLLVDRLVGHQDVVVKALDPALGKPPLVSGTTILGDGRVACILDVVRLIEQRATPGGARTAQPVSA
jgi:two-component system chemotaxis sensor kinase CheA